MKLVCFSVLLVVLVSIGAEGLRIRRPFRNRIRFLHEDQCGSLVKIDCLDREVRRRRFRQRFRSSSLSSPFICAQLTEKQLLKKLKDIGGYNPLYVAMNKKDAKKFKDPRTFELTETPTTPGPTRAKDCNRPTSTTSTPVTPTPTTMTTPARVNQSAPLPRDSIEEDHEKVSSMDNVFEKLREEERPEQDEPEEEVPEQDEPEEEDVSVQDEQDAPRRRVKRNVAVRDCWQKGAYVSGSIPKQRHMCSECRVVRQLPSNVIPQYINEAACGHTMPAHSGQPSQDNQCIASIGICTQKVLIFPSLVRWGYVRSAKLSAQKGMEIYVEKWHTLTQEIRASCQCQIYDSYVPILNRVVGR